MILKRIKSLWEQFLLDQAPKTTLPDFPPSSFCRWQIRFSGRVQDVGFRYEAMQMARQLDLTGYCENLPEGDVLAEFQGPENRIQYLISFLESIPRIVIEEEIIRTIPAIPGETGFDCR